MMMEAESVRAMKPSFTFRSTFLATVDADPPAVVLVSPPPQAASSPPTAGVTTLAPATFRKDLRSMARNLRVVLVGPVSLGSRPGDMALTTGPGPVCAAVHTADIRALGGQMATPTSGAGSDSDGGASPTPAP